MGTHHCGKRSHADPERAVRRRKGDQSTARTELAMTVLAERVVVMVIVLVSRAMLLMEKVMELLTSVLLQEMSHSTRYMQPFVYLERTVGVEGQDEGK